jgi:hypothetical protein
MEFEIYFAVFCSQKTEVCHKSGTQKCFQSIALGPCRGVEEEFNLIVSALKYKHNKHHRKAPIKIIPWKRGEIYDLRILLAIY